MLTIPDWMDNSLIYEWRQLLKRYLLNERGWCSDLSGKKITTSTGCHLHEALVSRAVVPKSVWWHYKIYHPFNSLLLLPNEHIPQPSTLLLPDEHIPPTREQALEILSFKYGIDKIRFWYYNLNWKGDPPFRV